MRHKIIVGLLISLFLFARPVIADDVGPKHLPARYFWLLETGCAQVEARLNAEPEATLKTLEAQPGWIHFPYAILAPVVLYAKKHPANTHYHEAKMLALAIRIGDLLASENEKGVYEPRLDSDWDTYMWLEAYRLLGDKLGAERQARWKREILKNIVLLEEECTRRFDFPGYHSPFLGTSPNHYSQHSSILYLAAKVFGNPQWEALTTKILRRFATQEQAPDGYWGEHNNSGPTVGYNHVTLTGLGLYWEHSKDPVVLPAIRRATDFHKYFTYPDGTVVEVINDRNRYWEPLAWGEFAFTNFADGRRLAEFAANFVSFAKPNIPALGRLAQDALYYHEGALAPIPQDQVNYFHQMKIPAGIRKTGPWVVALSGILSTQAVVNQYYLDRQGSMSIFHDKLGLIITGANSKRQPELATFLERPLGGVYHLPTVSRLQMNADTDRLSLAYHTFFTDLYTQVISDNEITFRYAITGKGPPSEEARLNLQLCLKEGEVLETGAGRKITLSGDKIELSPSEIGGWISHRGWKLKVDPTARLVWPMIPYNPYLNGPEKNLDHAVGVLIVPLRLKENEKYYIRPGEQEITFVLTTK
ncbi:MAG: hypothetical protein HY231_11230 [Acidobacteria bacterium]|nr:hypothetical protein [Acidobacteriota bacterium]